MIWSELDKAFRRAIAFSFSRKKWLLTFPSLVLCGLLVVFLRAIAFEASDWLAMSFIFLAVLLSSGMLLALGILLVRIHYHEVKHLTLHFRRLIGGSLDVLIGTAYLSVMPVLVYILLWMCLGVFFLLKETPLLGDFFSVIFAFGPFLLIFGALILCFMNVALLFFVAPVAALQSFKRLSLAKQVLEHIQQKPLSSLALLCIALMPLFVVVLLLTLAAWLTGANFLIAERSISVALEWFFIMIPFCGLLTPAVIFFFNFAAEGHQLLKSRTTS